MIQGLTTNPTPRAVRLGVLRKGAPKPQQGNRPGRDLDHFRFDPEGADQELLRAFKDAYPTGNDVEVYLPYPGADENFDAWQEEWTAAELKHRCDGVHVYERDQSGALYNTEQPCPGGCKQVGRLTVILPALAERAHRFGFVTVVTTSVYDIAELSQSLRYYEMLAGGDLRGIPFILSRRERDVSVPMNGRRSRVKKHLIFIEPSQRWIQNRMEVAQNLALTSLEERLRLTVSEAEDTTPWTKDEEDVVEGEARPVPDVEVKPSEVDDERLEGWQRYEIGLGYAYRVGLDVTPLPEEATLPEIVEASKDLAKQILTKVKELARDASAPPPGREAPISEWVELGERLLAEGASKAATEAAISTCVACNRTTHLVDERGMCKVCAGRARAAREAADRAKSGSVRRGASVQDTETQPPLPEGVPF